jgi:hypothetical protein
MSTLIAHLSLPEMKKKKKKKKKKKMMMMMISNGYIIRLGWVEQLLKPWLITS